MGKVETFPFRWVFPIGQLLLCTTLLWPLRSELYSNLRPKTPAIRNWPAKLSTVPALPGEKPGLTIIQVGSVPPPDQRIERVKQIRLSIPSSLNVPAFFLDMLIYSIVVDGTHAYDDKFGKSWRAVTWPLLGCLFWWMAGRAIEALSATRKRSLIPRIGPPEVTVAIVLLFTGTGVSLTFAFADVTRDLNSYAAAAGAALWALIGATMLIARLLQWRVRKALGTQRPEL